MIRIPDPWGKKAPDPGSGSSTMEGAFMMLKQTIKKAIQCYL
jgi:hypothetical protein